jgi:hypothetical protein
VGKGYAVVGNCDRLLLRFEQLGTIARLCLATLARWVVVKPCEILITASVQATFAAI